MTNPLLRSIAALLLPLTLAACASSKGPSSIAIDPASGDAAFFAAKDVLRDFGFQLERVDSTAGIITTAPKVSHGLATPWDATQSTAGQELSEYLNNERRRVRITFRSDDNSTQPSTQRSNLDVEVTLYRMQDPGLRPAPRAIVTTSRTTDPIAAPQGTAWQYEVPVSRDPALESRIAAAITTKLKTTLGAAATSTK